MAAAWQSNTIRLILIYVLAVVTIGRSTEIEQCYFKESRVHMGQKHI